MCVPTATADDIHEEDQLVSRTKSFKRRFASVSPDLVPFKDILLASSIVSIRQDDVNEDDTIQQEPRPVLKVRRQSLSLSSELVKSTETRKVCFTIITVYSHPIILGDNPAVSTGAPITIDWEPVDWKHRPVDAYESMREDRPKRQLKMGQVRRELLLKSVGYSRHDIHRVRDEIAKMKQGKEEDPFVTRSSQRVSAGKLPAFLAWLGPTEQKQ